MPGLDFLGTAPQTRSAASWLWRPSTAITIGAVAAGALLWGEHRWLGALGGYALASNIQAAHAGDRSWKSAAKGVGRHFMGIMGSLAVPKYPKAAYVAGYITGDMAEDLLFDGEGGGILERFAHYAQIREAPERVQLIDMTTQPKEVRR